MDGMRRVVYGKVEKQTSLQDKSKKSLWMGQHLCSAFDSRVMMISGVGGRITLVCLGRTRRAVQRA